MKIKIVQLPEKVYLEKTNKNVTFACMTIGLFAFNLRNFTYKMDYLRFMSLFNDFFLFGAIKNGFYIKHLNFQGLKHLVCKTWGICNKNAKVGGGGKHIVRF